VSEEKAPSMKNDLCQLQILDWKNSGKPPAIGPLLPDGDFRKILLKPNWVLHATHPEFPIEALVTSSALIEAVIHTCFSKYPNLESLIVGDVPLQSCDFEKMCHQSGIDTLRERCTERFGPRVSFLDLRRERYRLVNGFLELESDIHGDPSGYAEIVLDERSQLEEISHRADSFRVSDYDPEETRSVHHKGSHRYLVARSVLEADLVINLPKMKTHQKSGVTGALKNLVGINGSKAYLVHHHLGKPSQGGDEFPETASALFIWQVRLREVLQKKSRWIFRAAKSVWEILKKLRGIQTLATRESLSSGKVYVGAGSWHGNDSIWRMVYDLNLILVFGKAEGGVLANTPQRRVVSIMDGFIAGEGNGPLQPIPVETGVLLASQNPFLVDFAMAKLMGFDWRKIRLLANHRKFAWSGFGDFDPHGFEVVHNGVASSTGVDAIPVLKKFLPPPGWLHHIELEAC
jgi:uncharacterized protein (DUF362 family)